jgi:hypothetical protein
MQVLLRFSANHQPSAERPNSLQEPQANIKWPGKDHEGKTDPLVVDPNDIHDYVFHEECYHPIALGPDFLPAFLDHLCCHLKLSRLMALLPLTHPKT